MKPRLHASLIAIVILCITMGFLSFAQEGPPASFVVEDLQLISLASKPEWDNNWEYSRAVEAATILAWLHDHGYALLLGDLNEDGVIDELDTIELADRLGKHPMGCEEPRHPTDAWLVFGLAEYVAEKYPDIFELKIYDHGFPSEFERKMGRPFAPDAIPGITLTLESEPTFAAYMKELVEEEGVILGLEEEPGRNLYFAGRSFLRDPIAPNIHGIDLVWAQEDWYEPGTQGKVLETRARQTDAFYVDYQGGWMKVESMLALSPLYPPGEGPAEDCPDLIVVGSATCECSAPCMITVDATVMNIGAGEVPGPFVVTLMDIACGPHGECSKHVTISGGDLDQLNATGSVHVTFPFFGISVPTWPCPSCTFTLVVDSQMEIDEDCYPAPWGEYNNMFNGTVCCDGEEEPCPDLVVSGSHTCYLIRNCGHYHYEVHIKATVTNIEPGVPVSDPFGVALVYGCNDGTGGHADTKLIDGLDNKLAELNTTGSTTVDFWYDSPDDPTSFCCRYGLVVDYSKAVDESCHPKPKGEYNNVFKSLYFCCKEPPDQDGKCPDLTILGTHTCTCRETSAGELICYVDVDATVMKAGADVTEAFAVRLKYECEDGVGPLVMYHAVFPADINDGSEPVHFDFSFTPTDPTKACCAYDLFVDWENKIDEACFIDGESNNTFSPDEFCCDGTTQDCPDLMVKVGAQCDCDVDVTGANVPEGSCVVTVNVGVFNDGTAPVTDSFDVTLHYLCENGSEDTLTQTVNDDIAPSESTLLKFTYVFTPPDPDHSCCGYSVMVDSGYDIEECSPLGESNNVGKGVVCCEVPTEECVDLTIGGVAYCVCGYDLPNLASGTGYGCRMAVNATVYKAGPGEVPSVFDVRIRNTLCDGILGPDHRITLTALQLATLNDTGSVTIAFSWDIPWPPGEEPPCCTYTLTVDSLGAIAECPEGAEDNNTFNGRFCCEELPGCPDIVFVEESIRTSCKCKRTPIYERQCIRPGKPPLTPPCLEWADVLVGYETECDVSVHYTVKNIGTQDAGVFHVKLETDAGYTDTNYIPGLLAGEEKYRQFDFTTDTPGSVTVTLTADSDEEVDECDEDNNEATKTLNCR